MLINTWRRLRSPAAWAFLLIMGAPMLAEAQQGGLFPLGPIRRNRVPCEMEDPVYGLYRQEYFGYHPTCWRPFPAGWGCPSPEAPRVQEELTKRPLQPPAYMGAGIGFGEEGPGMEGPGPEPGVGPGPGAPRGNQIPPLPEDTTSPFNLDRPAAPPRSNPPTTPGTPPAPGSNPLELPPPAESDKPAAPTASNLPPAESDKPAAPTASNLPPAESDPPAGPAASNQPPAGSMLAPAAPGSEIAPLLALPDPAATAPGTPDPAAVPVPDVPPGPSAYNANVPPFAPTAGPNAAHYNNTGPSAFGVPPMQAPRRTSLLGGLFSGLGWKRR